MSAHVKGQRITTSYSCDRGCSFNEDSQGVIGAA